MAHGWKITWLGHSAFRLEAGSAIILIDPFITGNPGFKGDAEAASAGATHIVLTHGHDDHVGDTVSIVKRTKAQVISNFEVCMFLNSQGVKNINPGNPGGTVPCGDFTVSFTQAVHSSGTTLDGRSVYLGNPNGIVLKRKGSATLYHAGDTDIFGDMALIAEIHQPKIGILPIGDRFTMNAKTAALAAKRFFAFELVIPCHYASFPPLAPNADEFVKELIGAKVRALVPRVGEPVAL